ncbi:MAG: ABC transporter permease [Acidobacteriota bacterium]
MGNLIRDARYALRALRKSPGFASVAIATLAIGIGANTAIFSVVDSVLLRPLPYPSPDRLVAVHEADLERGFEAWTVSPPNFLDWRERSRSFAALSAYEEDSFAYAKPGRPARRVDAIVCTPGMPAVLGGAPVLGRFFSDEEARREGPRAVVLGYAMWKRELGADSRVVGRTIRLNGRDYPVVGVMPASFDLPGRRTEVWVPERFPANVATQRGAHYLDVLGRLKPGVAVEAADRELSGIMRQIHRENPGMNPGWTSRVVSLHDEVSGRARSSLWILLGAVGFVLLIACANVANLLLARSTARQGEIAIRRALGAGHTRLVRQLFTESLVLSTIGTVLGVAVASSGVGLLVRFGPADIPRLSDARIDPPVLVFAAILALATAVVFGLLPALRAARADVQEDLRSGGRASSGNRDGSALRSGLVVGEIAVSLLLLAGAGLLLRSLLRLQATDPGFRSASALTYEIALPQAAYPTPESMGAFYDTLLDRMRAIPGVRSAAAITGLPLTGASFSSSFVIEGAPPPSPSNEPSAQVRLASRDYFRAIRLPVVAGRGFEASDRRGSTRVIVASAAAARRFWPAGGAIGKRVRFGASAGAEKYMGEIVGIVGDVRDRSLAAPPRPVFYASLEQTPVDAVDVVLDAAVPPAGLIAPATGAVAALDPEIPVANARAVSTLVSRSVARQRFAAVLLGLFAATALLLAAIGTYGVLSYGVSLRRREIGLRAALGARPADLLALVLRHGLRLAGLGAAIGIAAAAAATRVLAGLLVGVRPTDAVSFAAAVGLLAVVSAAACAIPAWKAARVSPSEALRSE